jgi:hypothetical protein
LRSTRFAIEVEAGQGGIDVRKLIAFLGSLVTLAAMGMWFSPVVHAAGADTVDQFIIDCRYANERGYIDPIVAPGVKSAHSHDFFGRGDITTSSTPAGLAAGPETVTNCSSPSDDSGYWAPTLSQNGVAVNAVDFHTYWRRGAFPCNPTNDCRTSVQLKAWPGGVGYVAGDSTCTSPSCETHVFWDCGANSTFTSPHSTNPYDCSQYQGLGGGVDGVTVVIQFPQCWNGKRTTPAGQPYNMTQDFAYPTGSSCPSKFPTPILRLEEHIHYGIWNPCTPGASPCDLNDAATIPNLNITLSSGSRTPYPGTSIYSIHADAMNGWNTQSELVNETNLCLNGNTICAGVQV